MTTFAEQTEGLQVPADAQKLLFREARTANSFSSEPVTEEQVRAIYDLVKWAPTSMNTQPLRALVLRTAEAKARLLPHMSPGSRPYDRRRPPGRRRRALRGHDVPPAGRRHRRHPGREPVVLPAAAAGLR